MSRYDLCSFLRKELRAVHPRDLERATHLLVTLAVRCVEPGEFKETFIAARFDKTPVPPRIDPELLEERHVGSDWNDDFDDDESPETRAMEIVRLGSGITKWHANEDPQIVDIAQVDSARARITKTDDFATAGGLR
jgi:hypothetical protein